MARVFSEDCLEHVPNHFALCMLGARRARQLSQGSPALLHSDSKVAVTALREIAAGRVSYEGSVAAALEGRIAQQRSIDGTRGRTRVGDRAEPEE